MQTYCFQSFPNKSIHIILRSVEYCDFGIIPTYCPLTSKLSFYTKVWPEMSEIMTFLDVASAEKIAKILFLAE